MKTIKFLLLILPCFVFSQNMNNDTLEEIYTTVSDSIVGRSGSWQFHINEVPIMSLTDETHNRMRIISPIIDANRLTEDLLKASLVANFHTALDVKYAVSDGILWSVFIHPLKELSSEQVKDAISQVYHANVTFGSTFASTSLSFPAKISDKPEQELDKNVKYNKI